MKPNMAFCTLMLALLYCGCASLMPQDEAGKVTGINLKNTLAVEIGFPTNQSAPPQSDLLKQVIERISALPGIMTVAAIDTFPADQSSSRTLVIEGTPPSSSTSDIRFNVITPAYFAIVNLPLLSGRLFSERDNAQTPSVAIISKSTAQQFFSGMDPIGRRVSFADSPPGQSALEVVGVVADVSDSSNQARTEIYVPFSQNPIEKITLIIRASVAPGNFVEAVKAEIQAADRDVTISNIRTF